MSEGSLEDKQHTHKSTSLGNTHYGTTKIYYTI